MSSLGANISVFLPWCALVTLVNSLFTTLGGLYACQGAFRSRQGICRAGVVAGGNRQAGVSMNSKLSHSETVNSMEQLYRSLETLEQHIGRSADRLPEQPLQLERLSGDEIAASGSLPEKAIERLVGQVTTLAGERAPATLETDHILHGIEQRFDMLSDLARPPAKRGEGARSGSATRTRAPLRGL